MSAVLTHLALHVRDIESCIAFYQEYAGLKLIHQRDNKAGGEVVWLAEAGREQEFILVLLPGGPGRNQLDSDFSHLGFALPSRAAVDVIAARGKQDGILAWATREEPYPVGYYCGLRDPDGNFVEFSYGQPLGPGANG
ncbi:MULTISPECIES: VOC family protein [Zhongshania]|jgi:catechol 2,3-dioxygenase-like lactoylglutathione lyase family enzyme|uniref:Catechol 2,3-dioxygenase-like lactoylglutathione lyase family enzyme n=1 Tax=Zhongshania antarctica TaxID=641702 RepID=A0A840R8A8_9GAMM|nr:MULTISPECIES: VOC family protein [Zhongshania]MBB5188612.1 catechol 2,3-dioxygenase-like lactoylglutathione lyase family enzyme [Zhongshania antarctica]